MVYHVIGFDEVRLSGWGDLIRLNWMVMLEPEMRPDTIGYMVNAYSRRHDRSDMIYLDQLVRQQQWRLYCITPDSQFVFDEFTYRPKYASPSMRQWSEKIANLYAQSK